MISELCPIDRLTQRAGRLCRFDKSKIGELHVLVPQKKDSIYPAPYGEYNKKEKAWIPCDALIKTEKMLKPISYSAGMLVDMLNLIYPTETSYSAKAIANANNLKEYFRFNWLIGSRQNPKQDDTDLNFWCSRNIAPQDTVFVTMPDSIYFYNYLKYQNWKLENSLELPLYLIEKAKKNHIIDILKIQIKDNEETIYVVREGFYNNKKGILFVEEDVFL